MLTTVVPRISVRQVVLGADGLLSSGTITPAVTPTLPKQITGALVYNAAAWYFTERASGVQFPVTAGATFEMPGSYVRNTIFKAGTYIICFYQDL